jgi:signal peptidase I
LNQPSAFVSSHFDISDIYISDIDRKNKIITHIAQLTDKAYQKVKNNPNVIEVEKLPVEEGTWNRSAFPQDPRFKWNTKYFGPIMIPKAGKSTEITIENIALYKRIIEVYEGSEFGIKNKISLSGTQVKLNGKILTEYTFLQDYYWMMGDNRDNSQDARMWGFVPFNHVVGKPVFIWMSWDSNAEGFINKIRWERLFTTVGGEGKPVSYFTYFVFLLGAWFIFDFFRKRKRKA